MTMEHEIDLSSYLDRPGEWMKGEGEGSEIVVSSRARLARNVDGRTFCHRASPEERSELLETLRDRVLDLEAVGDLEYMSLEGAEELDLNFLVERQLISQELAEAEGARGVAIGPEETFSLMMNEEDHLRMQVMRSGLNLREAWEQLDEIDSRLEERVKYAFSPRYGYLTACPTNCGTALRVSVMLHLPVLELTDQMDKVFQSLSRINFTARGLFGEGSRASGNFYQISNQTTMNKSEEEFVDQLEEMVPEIVRFETESRERMQEERPVELKDRIWRAVGTLKYARTITAMEAAQCLSALRLGVSMDILDGISYSEMNEMFIHSLPAHLQKSLDLELESEIRDQRRANYLREKINDYL